MILTLIRISHISPKSEPVRDAREKLKVVRAMVLFQNFEGALSGINRESVVYLGARHKQGL